MNDSHLTPTSVFSVVVQVEFVRVVSPGIAAPEAPERSGALGRTAEDVLPAPDTDMEMTTNTSISRR